MAVGTVVSMMGLVGFFYVAAAVVAALVVYTMGWCAWSVGDSIDNRAYLARGEITFEEWCERHARRERRIRRWCPWMRWGS